MVAILELGSSFAEEEAGTLRFLHGKKEMEMGGPGGVPTRNTSTQFNNSRWQCRRACINHPPLMCYLSSQLTAAGVQCMVSFAIISVVDLTDYF